MYVEPKLHALSQYTFNGSDDIYVRTTSSYHFNLNRSQVIYRQFSIAFLYLAINNNNITLLLSCATLSYKETIRWEGGVKALLRIRRFRGVVKRPRIDTRWRTNPEVGAKRGEAKKKNNNKIGFPGVFIILAHAHQFALLPRYIFLLVFQLLDGNELRPPFSVQYTRRSFSLPLLYTHTLC